MVNNMLRKGLVLGIIIVFVGASVVPSTGMVGKSPSSRNILYVCGDGPGNSYWDNRIKNKVSPTEVQIDFGVQPDHIPFGTTYVGSSVDGSFMVFEATELLSINKPSWIIIRKTFEYASHCDIHFSVNTTIIGNYSGNISVETDAGTAQLPVSINIRDSPSSKLTLLVVSSPFDKYSTSDGSKFDVMTRIMEENYINVSYTEDIPTQLSIYDGIILAEEALASISSGNVTRIKNFVNNGGNILVFADLFFGGTIFSANQIINDYGLNMIYLEDGGEIIVNSSYIVSDPITTGITSLRFWRPSPMETTNPVSKILIERPFNTSQGYIGISRGDGTVIVVGDSLWWYSFLYEGYYYDNGKIFVNILFALQIKKPPVAPTIIGPTNGKAGTFYPYTFTSIDPDGDHVSYYIEWGDGDTTTWTEFRPSGPPGYSESHSWSTQGTYIIQAKAKDIYGAESDWGTLKVTMPVNQQVVVTSNQQSLKTILRQFLSFQRNVKSPLTR